MLLGGCYGGWLALLLGHGALGPSWIPAAVLLVTLHSSLQHEMLHGHPTPSRRLNELLAFPALGLFVPYRRFRDLHIAHHRDEHLTDPYDDPESWYVAEERWRRSSTLLRRLLALNATLLGRVLLGPALALAGFWRSEWRTLRGTSRVAGASERGSGRRETDVSRRRVAIAWLAHAVALVPVLAVLRRAGIDPFLYAAAVAYPAMSLLMIRTFIEHRAAERVAERTVVVEAGPLMSLLFLNNNLHAVHHRAPSLPWFALPAEWRTRRRAVLDDNGGYHFPDGYAGVARRWLLARREPVVHPFRRRADDVSKGASHDPDGCRPAALSEPTALESASWRTRGPRTSGMPSEHRPTASRMSLRVDEGARGHEHRRRAGMTRRVIVRCAARWGRRGCAR